MVEIIYNSANADMMRAENLIRLPKNIRQIGTVGDKVKIYTEDYVKSYLNQQFERNSDTGFVLFGKTIATKDRQYIFIDGAISVDIGTVFHSSIEVHAEAWEKLNIAGNEYFTDLEIVGWACEGDIKSMEEIHRHFFQEGSKIFIQLSDIETEYYLADLSGMQRQEGYYIYYARNEAMQTYMVEQQNENRISNEDMQEEPAIEQFRQIMKERKEIVRHGKMVTVLSCASSFLAILVLAIGITMINNYEKMQAMEVALVEISSTLSEDESMMQAAYEENTAKETEQIMAEEQAKNTEEGVTEQTIATEETAAEAAGEALVDKTDTQTADYTTINIEETEQEIQETVILDAAPATEIADNQTYTVKKGDTLARISMQFYQTRDMVDSICELNQISNKDIILCGQKILLP